MGILRTAFLMGSQSTWLAKQVRNRRFAQRAVKRFLPGEDVESALHAAKELQGHGIATVLTQLGENVTDAAAAEQVGNHYKDLLDRIDQRALPAHLSVKLTQLGLDVSRETCSKELSALVSKAQTLGNFVWIDMEGSVYTDVTLELFRGVRRNHTNVGVCVQSYLHRTGADLEQLLSLPAALRLVKGAYQESQQIAFPRKKDVDANYLTLAKRLLSDDARRNGVRPGFGTHDMRLVDLVRAHARDSGIPNEAFEIQMLYGIRTDDQLRLAKDGYKVRVLISYGSAWFPWYMRRLAERPANVVFALKSMVR